MVKETFKKNVPHMLNCGVNLVYPASFIPSTVWLRTFQHPVISAFLLICFLTNLHVAVP